MGSRVTEVFRMNKLSHTALLVPHPLAMRRKGQCSVSVSKSETIAKITDPVAVHPRPSLLYSFFTRDCPPEQVAVTRSTTPHRTHNRAYFVPC